MTINDLIVELSSMKPSLREKEIFVISPNGLKFEPKIKRLLKDNLFSFDDDATECMVITYIIDKTKSTFI